MNSPLRGPAGSRYIGHIQDRVAGRQRPAPASAPVLKEAPAATASAIAAPSATAGTPPAGGAPVDAARAANRRNLLITSVPLLLVAAFCLFTLVKRSAIDPLVDRRFGNMSRSEARTVAGALCARLTGETARAVDASQQAAFSCRRQAVVREWDVICDTPEGRYLLRINADTRRVYAVNRLQRARPAGVAVGAPAGYPGPDPRFAALPADEAEQERLLAGAPLLSREAAEARAREYLRLLGVPADGLRRVEEPIASGEGVATPEGVGAPAADTLWNFTYRRAVPGLGERLLKVSVNGRSGELEHVWNPVSAL